MDASASTDLLMAQLQAACSHLPSLRPQEDGNGHGLNNALVLSNRNSGSERQNEQGLLVHSLLHNPNNSGQNPGNHSGLMDLLHGEFMDNHNWLTSSTHSVPTNLQTLGPLQASSVLQSSPWANNAQAAPSQASLVQSILADQSGLLNAVVVDLAKGNHPISQNFFRSGSDPSLPNHGQSNLLALGNSSNKALSHPFLENSHKLGLRSIERSPSVNLEPNQLSTLNGLWRPTGGLNGLDASNGGSASPNRESGNITLSNAKGNPPRQQLWTHSSSEPDLQASEFLSKWRSSMGIDGPPPMIDKLSLDSLGKSFSGLQDVHNRGMTSPGAVSATNTLRQSESLPDASSGGKESLNALADGCVLPPTLVLDLAPPGGSDDLIGRFGMKSNPGEPNRTAEAETLTRHLSWSSANPNTSEQDNLMYSFMQDREKQEKQQQQQQQQQQALSLMGLNPTPDKSKVLSEPVMGVGNGVRSDFSYSMFSEAARDQKWAYPMQQQQQPQHPQQQQLHQPPNPIPQNSIVPIATNGVAQKIPRNGYHSSDSDNADKVGQEEVLHPDLNQSEHCADNLLASNHSDPRSRKRSMEKDEGGLDWSNGREKRVQFSSDHLNENGVNWDEEEEEEEEEMTKDKHQAMVEALLPRRPGPRRKSGPVTAPCAAARERRERIACHIRTLQRLVPSRNKMDSASVLADTIRFVKQLLKQIQEMKSERGELSGGKDVARLTMASGSADMNDGQRVNGEKNSHSGSINGSSAQSPNASTC